MKWNILSMVLYAFIWLAWGAIIYFGLPKALNVNWFGVILILLLGLWLGSIYDRLQIVIELFIWEKSYRSLSHFYWNWIPTLTLGVLVALWPWRFGWAAYDLYGSELMGIKEWIIIFEVSLFPILNIYSILRTPFSVKQSMKEDI